MVANIGIINMQSAAELVLDEYERRLEQERRRMSEIPDAEFERHLDEFLLPVGRNAGVFMNILIRDAGARNILEIGTSYGYSTLWLADAASEVGGKVISIDLHADKQAYAREALQRANLSDFVEFRSGDALETIPALEHKVDFVLLDLWKSLYVPCFDLFYPKLNAGAIIVADNMIIPEGAKEHAQAYQQRVRGKADIDSILLPIGHGLEVSRRQ
jgi:predicted O-methyltransferase YrrM